MLVFKRPLTINLICAILLTMNKKQMKESRNKMELFGYESAMYYYLRYLSHGSGDMPCHLPRAERGSLKKKYR